MPSPWSRRPPPPWALWALAGRVAGVELAAESNGQTQPIQPTMVVAASVLAGVGAWVVLALLERLTAQPPGPVAVGAAPAPGA